MSNENFKPTLIIDTEPAQPETQLSFEVREHKPGVTLYIFGGLAVAIDITGKNYNELPELSFGPYNNITNTGTLKQPATRQEGIDMEYVAKCIKKVSEVSGIQQFWFYPFGDDVSDEHKERRERARVRLLESAFSVQPAPSGRGFILSLL